MPDAFFDFRRSDNIEDRRKEMFNSHPQAPQLPNVFVDKLSGYKLLTELSQDDFAPIQNTPLSEAAGANVLQAFIDKYMNDRQPGKMPEPRMFDIFK